MARWHPHDPRFRLFRTLLLSGAVLAAAGGYFCLMEVAAIWDGPGVGLFARGPRGHIQLFGLVWLAGTILFAVGAARSPSWAWRGLAVAAGLVLFVALLLAAAAGRIAAVTWPARCRAGDAWFCVAAGDRLHQGAGLAAKRQEARVCYRLGCQRAGRRWTDVTGRLEAGWAFRACSRLLDYGASEDRRLACTSLSDGCRWSRAQDCAEHQKVCGARGRSDEETCSDLQNRCRGEIDVCYLAGRPECARLTAPP